MKNEKYEATQKKGHSTLQSYFMSLLGLVLCCTMFMSTTFAWFSADVVSTGNQINVGTLKVSLLHHEGTALTPVTASHQVFDKDVKWQPDHAEVEVLTVKNIGDLAFDYQLQFIADADNCVFTDGLTMADIAKWFEVYCYGGDAADATDDMTDPNWVKVGTLAQVLSHELAVTQGTLENTDDTATVAVALYLSKDATDEIMGQKISIHVKLTANQQGITETETPMETVTATADQLADPDFFKGKDNTVFKLTGNYEDLQITTESGLNQVFDGTGAAVSGTVTINVPGVAHAYSSLDAARKGTVTVNGFTANTLNVLAYNNEQVNITNNTVKSMSVIGGNFALNIQGNTVDGDFGNAYKDGENNTNEYGISLRICDYTLSVTNNTITDTYSHAIGLNGRQDESGTAWGKAAQITAFSGNTITVNTTAKTGRGAFKLWNDAVYDPLSGSTPNDAAKALIATLLDAANENQFALGDGHYAVVIDSFKTNEPVA